MLRRITLFLYLTLSTVVSFAAVDEIKIAAGSMSGVYYPVALQMCNFITKYSPVTRCNVLATSGSLNNMSLLLTEKVDFAFVQSDIAKEAYNSEGIFKNQRPFKSLRLVARLFPEVFSIIAKDESGIVNFSDLNSRKIGLNLNGSGTKSGLINLLKYFKFPEDPEILNVQDSQMSSRLCDNKIDAVLIFTGHPNGAVTDITDKCDVEFVSIDGFKLEALLSDNVVYDREVIPAQIYKRISRSASTFSTRSLLVTNSDTDKAKVDLVTRLISRNFEEFTALYPVLNNLTKKDVFGKDVVPLYDE